MELTTLTDEQLADHLNAVVNEQERRQRLAMVPGQMAAMTARYVEDGGDKEELLAELKKPTSNPVVGSEYEDSASTE